MERKNMKHIVDILSCTCNGELRNESVAWIITGTTKPVVRGYRYTSLGEMS